MKNQETNFIDGYCNLCDSCGEEACCSPIRCLQQHMIINRNKECTHGDIYFKDILFGYKTSQMYSRIFDSLEKGEYDLKVAIELMNDEWDNIYDWVYNNKPLIDEE